MPRASRTSPTTIPATKRKTNVGSGTGVVASRVAARPAAHPIVPVTRPSLPGRRAADAGGSRRERYRTVLASGRPRRRPGLAAIGSEGTMRLSEWRARAPHKDAGSPRLAAVVDPVLAALGSGPDPHCWVV